MAKEYLIGDFLKRIKRPIDLEPNQDYNLVTIKMNHKGVVLRGKKKGCDIKSKMYQVKEGDFILSGIDARNGAFGIVGKELEGAIVTNDFWYFEIDETIISKRLFLELTATTWFDEICQKGSDGTTQRIRLQKDKFFNQKILLPEGDKQKELLNKILTFKKSQSKLNKEIDNQKHLLSQLKQSILQEAIQGKLTADWREQTPTTEPVSELLKRIKAEKAQLIKDKKIKKEKPVPPITKEEIPFELPEGWVWCRIPQVLALTKDPLRRGPFGSSLRKDMFVKQSDKTTKVYEQQHAIKKQYNLGGYYISVERHPNLKSFLTGPGDILVSCAGTIGETYKLPKEAPIGIINQALLKIRLNENVIVDDFFLSMFKSQIKVQVNSDAKGSAMKNMGSVKYLKNELVFGLPPFEEQKEIVKKVEALMQQCQELEQEIQTSEANAQLLMQAVLKGAFEGKKEV